MTKLNDLELVLLTSAAKRENGSVFPPPASIANTGERLSAAINSLHKLGLIAEGRAPNAKAVWRTEDDTRIGAFITDAGRTAINLEPEHGEPKNGRAAQAPGPKQTEPNRQTKSASLMALLQRGEGATLAEMIAATGWLPHTTRAALTGLRKKGHSLEKSNRGAETCYRIDAKA